MNWKTSSKYLHSGLSRIRFALAVVITAPAVPRVAQSKHPISLEDLMKVRLISDIQVSLDSRWIAYVLTTVALKANKKTGHLWTVPTQGGCSCATVWASSRQRESATAGLFLELF